ncbi:MAG: sensor histidine kinase [Phyllobacterium sp.]
MASSEIIAADKIVVDRRKLPRNRDLSHVVRAARTRLSEQSGTGDFDGELLQMHAHSIVRSFPFIFILTLGLAGAAFQLGLKHQAVIWILAICASYGTLAAVAEKFRRSNPEKIDPARWRSLFLSAHLLTGSSWTYLVATSCPDCGTNLFPALQAIVLTVAIAGTALTFSTLREATLATFSLPVGAYAIVNLQTASQPLTAAMMAFLAGCLILFSFVASRFNLFQTMALAQRAEKEALIADLETAKSMSDEARHRAEEANLAKSRFLASMSHELRTPLNAILGFSEVLSKEVLGPIQNETYREYARDIHNSGRHLLDLINEILDLSRVEAGRYVVNEVSVYLPDIADECINMMQLKARGKGVTIIADFESDLARLLCDERAIRQILLNLLSNAVKFTPGGGEIRVKLGWTAGGGQYVAIKDNGPGIPPDEIPVVLSAFGQGSIAIKSAEQGAGLGLPIVQALVKMHGGEFHIRSKMREGTETLATFPASRVVDKTARTRKLKETAYAA